MDIYDQISDIKKLLKLNNEELGIFVNKSGDTFRKALNRKSLSDFELMFLADKLLDIAIQKKLENTPEIILFKKTINGIKSENTRNLNNLINESQVNEPSEIFKTKSGNIIEELPNGKYKLSVPLVPYRAYATYISEYQDAEFIDGFTMATFIVDFVPRGSYRAFEIQNDSMNDGTLDSKPSRDAILHGDIVLGREVGRQHWKEPLKISRYPYWIIVHKETIVCKEIIRHNIEKGVISCHSLNNSPEFSDFDLELNDVLQLFNIVKKQVD